MKLTMGERFSLLGLIPEHGSIFTLKAARVLREALVPTEKEHKEYTFKEVPTEKGTSITWNSDVAGKTKEIEIPPIMAEFFAKALKDLSEKDQLTEQLVPLYEKFIPEVK